MLLLFSATICSTQEIKKITTDKLLMRIKFQQFLSKAPRSSFKILILSTPPLLRGLHMIKECKQSRLCEPPPVPYLPVKDEVQEEVSKMRNLQIKTLLEKDTTLNFLVGARMGPGKPS